MNRRKFLLPLILLSLALASWPLIANTIVEDLDISGFRPSPRYPGLVLAHPTPQSWQRCPLVHFRVNDNLDPIPNPLGPAFLRVEDTLPVFRQAAKLWNDIPTSFMEIQVDGTVDNPGRTGFDFVNEISFRTGPLGTLGFPNVAFRGVFERDLGIIAAVRRTTLLTDFEFVDGLDADGDGDVDFTASISQCGDQDSDGDIEMAAGAYKAGALLDADIMFSTGTNIGGVTDPGFRYTIDPADIDASDPQSELDKRALDLDSILTASRRYPEGSAATGAAALQPGDVAFAPTVGYITGNVTLGATNQPLAGANVFAIDHTTGRVVSSTITGHTTWDTQPNGFNTEFVGYRSEGWPWRIFDEIWRNRPPRDPRATVESIREVLAMRWIHDQYCHHDKTFRADSSWPLSKMTPTA